APPTPRTRTGPGPGSWRVPREMLSDRARTPGPSLRAYGVVICEVPAAHIAGLEPDEEVVACGLEIPLAAGRAQVAGGDPLDDRSVLQRDQPSRRPKLEPTVRRSIVADDDARAWVSAKVRRLPITGVSHDVEAAVSPLVPDRGQQHRSDAPVRRQD